MNRFFPLFVTLIVVLCDGCGLNRGVSLRVTQESNEPVFHFQLRSINGLSGLRLWRADTKQVLWDVSLNYYREKRLKYGDIPKNFRSFNGQLQRAYQMEPSEKQKPAPLPSNKTFIVEVHYQYDTSFAPSTGVAYFSFTTDSKGVPAPVTRLERVAADEIPPHPVPR